MAIIIGFPRIGENRELKRVLESYWSQKSSQEELLDVAKKLRQKHWECQKGLEFVCVNDFSFYDNMLDLSFALGAIPERFRQSTLQGLDLYFAMARGAQNIPALEMTKWFNTNYHYVVPELDTQLPYNINANSIKEQYQEAKAQGYAIKISIIGIFTYLALSKFTDSKTFEEHFLHLREVYIKLLQEIINLEDSPQKITFEFDEPIFVKGKDKRFFHHIKDFYNDVKKLGCNVLIGCFFEEASEALEILSQSNVDGFILDFVHGSTKGIEHLKGTQKKLFAGVIDGRNIWIASLEEKLKLLRELQEKLPDTPLSVSSSCSLLHVPYSKAKENNIPQDIQQYFSFALEKIEEIKLLESYLKNTPSAGEQAQWEHNQQLNTQRKKLSHASKTPAPQNTNRSMPYKQRIKCQREHLNLPLLPTTTIGSFPQNSEIRNLRRDFKKGVISETAYKEGIKNYIQHCVLLQEKLGFDVLVHGEPERNDMVEYFGEQLEGFVFSQNAWVQSYGSRCVKPPIIYADIRRKAPMTLEWITYAQSLTKKILKGMLTGPVTILNWSFVRDDKEREEVCTQIALAIAEEIDDLQKAGIKVIQVDEAAFKEGYPLRKEKVSAYEKWATESFKIATSVAKPEVQIHTHMCYSQFNDIMESIHALDADVISIECARSGNTLLKAFRDYEYTHEVGPGVYDIHSPQIPSVDHIKQQIQAFLEVLPKEQLWINPDCGLKTRKEEEVEASLANLIKATQEIRKTL